MSFAYLGPISGPKRNNKEKGLPLGRVLTDLENEFGSHQIIGDPQNGKEVQPWRTWRLGVYTWCISGGLSKTPTKHPNIPTNGPTNEISVRNCSEPTGACGESAKSTALAPSLDLEGSHGEPGEASGQSIRYISDGRNWNLFHDFGLKL